MLFPSVDSFNCYKNICRVPVARYIVTELTSPSLKDLRVDEDSWLSWKVLYFPQTKKFSNTLEVLHPDLLPLPVFRTSSPIAFYYFDDEKE